MVFETALSRRTRCLHHAPLTPTIAAMTQLDPGRSLISSYGLFWKVEDTEWNIDGARKGTQRMLGRLGSKGSSMRVADFWSQSGIYVLYGNYGLYYVGIASQVGR